MPRARPYVVVWVLFVFAWVANYLVRMGFAALLPPIMKDLGLSYTRAGVLASAFFGAYAVMQFPAGLLGDRFGRRRILLLGLIGGALASASTALAVSFATLLGARLFTGLSQGCLFSNDRPIIAAVTPPERIALGQAVSFMGPGLGITFGLWLGGALGEWMDWRRVFVIFALPPVAAALLIRGLVPAPPPAPGRWGLGRGVLRERDLWVLGAAGSTAMWVQYVFATWGPLLLMEAGVSELGRAGLFASLQGLAGVAGLLAGGWLADRAHRVGIGRRAVVVGTLATLAVATLTLAVAVQHALGAGVLTVLLFLVACSAWGVWGPSFAILGDVAAGRELSTAFGLYNTVCVLGAVVGPAVTGWARDVTGSFAAGSYVCAAVALGGAGLLRFTRRGP
jgi:predicted MFS family arabinose efflux permease